MRFISLFLTDAVSALRVVSDFVDGAAYRGRVVISKPHVRSAVVIGGTGALGWHICAALLRAGTSQVTAVARHEGPVVSGAGLLRADLLNNDNRALSRLISNSDVVVNAAGDSWRGTPDQMVASHTVLVERLLRLMPPDTRLVHLGSVHEYGHIPHARPRKKAVPSSRRRCTDGPS